MIKKVIIWGHKLHTHTHSYIHNGYYKAFKNLGYDTYWFDNNDLVNLVGFDFEESLFFTEGQVDQNIPINSSSLYVLHFCKIQKYVNAKCRILNLCNYVKYCEEGISFNYKDTNNSVDKIKDFVFFDKKAVALYQPWATDLLPAEIDLNSVCLFDDSKNYVNYVGSVWYDNESQIRPFINTCFSKNKIFKDFSRVSDEENKSLTRNSYIAPDIRGDWHIECGYIPCRLFKNISYGQVTATNSPHLYKLFGDRIAFNISTLKLFDTCVEKHKNMTKNMIKDNMLYIKDNHTYINRANNLIEMLKNIYQ